MADTTVMTKIKGISNVPGQFIFMCLGCKEHHAFWTERHESAPGPKWTFNGDKERPTVSPSLLLRSTWSVPPVTAENYDEWKRNPWPQHKEERVCHSFIREGKIEYLSDCTHELAGQTVELPNLE